VQLIDRLGVPDGSLGLRTFEGMKMNEIQFTSALRSARTPLSLFSAALFILLAASGPGQAQGIVRGAQEGAHEGNRVAGPVGGVVGGAVGAGVGGAVGAVEGVFGVPHRGYRCHGYYRHGYYHCYR
jgi:hypothetical protein